MNRLVTLFLITGLCFGEIMIIDPQDLANSIKHVDTQKQGSLTYSVSTFGHILYADTASVEVLLPERENDQGCSPLIHPSKIGASKFVWLFERGICTFAAKAFNSQQSGSYAVLVHHNQENADVQNIIPSGDSFYNHLKIPIILITKEDGIKIKQNLLSGKRVFITIDLEIVS